MLSLQDYTSHDGLGLAELVARKEVKPEELLEAALSAVEKVNPKINAVLQTLPDQARAAIRQGLPQGPFHGVPFLIKELVLHAKNVRCDMGSRLAQGLVPPEDTELMARFRRAGLLLAGTTQTPELGYNPTTETVLFGPVHNPWDLGRSAGGSSGGSGGGGGGGHRADRARQRRRRLDPHPGLVRRPRRPEAYARPHADRTGLRRPALRPRLRVRGDAQRARRGRAARRRRRARRRRAEPSGAAGAPLPRRHRAPRPSRLRIAWTVTPASGQRSTPNARRPCTKRVRLLEGARPHAVEDAPRYDWDTFLENVHVIWTGFTVLSVEGVCAATGRKPGPDNLEAVTLACYEDGKRFSALDLLNSMAHGNTLSRQVGAFFEKVDVLVTPTIARPPAPLGELDQNRKGMTAMEWTRQVFGYVPFTPLFNSTGQPADLAAAALERGRLADRRADRRPLRRRSHVAPAGRAARAGAAVEGQAPEGPCRRVASRRSAAGLVELWSTC